MVGPSRIVLTVPSLAPEFGGPVTKAIALAESLRRLDRSVTVVGVGAASAPGVVSLGSAASFHGTPVPWALHRIAALVRAAEVVHVIGLRDPVGTAAALVARAWGIPYVIEPAGMHRRRLRSLWLKRAFDVTIGKTVLAGARRLVATSTMEGRELIDDGIDACRVVVRPNGIVIPVVRPRGAFRARVGVAGDAPLVLALGRITRKKGLVPLVEEVAQLPGVHLAIAGPDGGDGTLQSVHEARERLGVRARVHVVSRALLGEDKADAFADADVFCLWSLHENFGLAAGEAAACGAAVVVSDQCGVAEWLGSGVVVVPSGDRRMLRERLRQLLGDPAARVRLGTAGRAAARALNWDHLAQLQLQLYQGAA